MNVKRIGVIILILNRRSSCYLYSKLYFVWMRLKAEKAKLKAKAGQNGAASGGGGSSDGPMSEDDLRANLLRLHKSNAQLREMIKDANEKAESRSEAQKRATNRKIRAHLQELMDGLDQLKLKSDFYGKLRERAS